MKKARKIEMICPFRTKIITTHKNGDETTSTEWMKCYTVECPAYEQKSGICRKFEDEFEFLEIDTNEINQSNQDERSDNK